MPALGSRVVSRNPHKDRGREHPVRDGSDRAALEPEIHEQAAAGADELLGSYVVILDRKSAIESRATVVVGNVVHALTGFTLLLLKLLLI